MSPTIHKITQDLQELLRPKLFSNRPYDKIEKKLGELANELAKAQANPTTFNTWQSSQDFQTMEKILYKIDQITQPKVQKPLTNTHQKIFQTFHSALKWYKGTRPRSPLSRANFQQNIQPVMQKIRTLIAPISKNSTPFQKIFNSISKISSDQYLEDLKNKISPFSNNEKFTLYTKFFLSAARSDVTHQKSAALALSLVLPESHNKETVEKVSAIASKLKLTGDIEACKKLAEEISSPNIKTICQRRLQELGAPEETLPDFPSTAQGNYQKEKYSYIKQLFQLPSHKK